ncbi:Synaptogyrin [Strongyloides ratti]|uniref:Synaptogyrin n=1 Tax=Strongyloides ratti TaxID=34506 RepID=A0A090LMT1_STRRB|nr:Synaptogyrin [Strongyloides ratti]CEF71056.1 Synaptogyrin [Strongyloides ratti]
METNTNAFQAYGSSMATSNFDFKIFIKKTTVTLRILAIILSIFIWYLISSGAWYRLGTGHLICLYERSSTTCSFGSFMGSCALIIAIIFLIIEAKYEQFSCVGTRKRIVLADLITSLAASFLFIITTFTLWTKYSSLELEENYNGRSAKFAVLFSFLSAIVWGVIALYAYRQWQASVQEQFDGTQFHGAPQSDIITTSDYGYGGDSTGIGVESNKTNINNMSYQQSQPGQLNNIPNTQQQIGMNMPFQQQQSQGYGLPNTQPSQHGYGQIPSNQQYQPQMVPTQPTTYDIPQQQQIQGGMGGYTSNPFQNLH